MKSCFIWVHGSKTGGQKLVYVDGEADRFYRSLPAAEEERVDPMMALCCE
jgi:hypothetical protein